jgi:hypothetical protein
VRRLACGLALLAAAGTAQADEIRAVPAVGAKLTYRLVSTTKTPDKTFSAGSVHTYIVTKSDGKTAEGIIKPNAVILGCAEGKIDLGCKDAAASPGAHWDGNLLTVPIDGDSGNALAKESAFKLYRFLGVLRKFPFPSSRDPKAYDLYDFGPDPAFVTINTLDCGDLATLDALLPFGSAPQAALTCDMGFERSASRNGKIPAQQTHAATAVEIDHTGSGWITLPSGNWQVEKYAVKTTPKDAGQQQTEGETLVSPQLGVAVRSHLVASIPAAERTVENTIELVSVSP